MQFFSADFLFDGYRFLPKGSVLVMNEGVICEILKDKKDDVQYLKGLLMPGMINAHCHLELSHMKGMIEEHTGLVNFLLSVLVGRIHHSDNIIMEAIASGEKEMIQNGIVAVGDISNTTHTLLQKQQGNLQYHTFVECFGLLDNNARERFEARYKVFEEFEKDHAASLVLHAPYSISDSLIECINKVSKGKLTTIHNQESMEENVLFKSGQGDFLKLFDAILNGHSFFIPSGKTSLQTYLPKLTDQQKIILVHNTFTSKEDMAFSEASGKEIYWCLCPNANVYIENTLPDIKMMMDEGCQLVLGTDSLASNHQLSILDEILTIQNYLPSISLEEKLRWATSNGAKALGMNSLGSFEVGKKPGLVQVENVIHPTELPKDPVIVVRGIQIEN